MSFCKCSLYLALVRETPCALLGEKLDGLAIQRVVFDYERGKTWAPSADGNVWRLTEKDVVPPRATVRFESLNDALLVHGVHRAERKKLSHRRLAT